MDRYVVIGNPVAHSLSPEIHARFGNATGDPIEYGRLLAPAAEFAACTRRFFEEGGRGANVTLPFKVEAYRFAQVASDRARLAGAANFLAVRDAVVHADNTDGAGLVADLVVNLGLALRGARILLVGAGGAARGVIGPLLTNAPAQLVVANRTHARAIELAGLFAHLGRVVPATLEAIPAGPYALVINATSTSTKRESLTLPPGVIAPGVFAYDMASGDSARPFVEAARAAGARASDGLGMLVEQAAESFFHWRGRRPPTGAVLAEMRARFA
jgi:shikimate dehydrogenase